VKAKTEGIVVLDEDGKTNTNLALIQIVSETVDVIGQVSEYDYNALSINQKVKIKSVSTDDEIEGKIVSIAILPLSDANVTGTTIYQFVIEIKEFIQYGSSVNIELAENKIIIPKGSLIKNGDETFVFLYEDGKVVMTKITYIEERGLILVLEFCLGIESKIKEANILYRSYLKGKLPKLKSVEKKRVMMAYALFILHDKELAEKYKAEAIRLVKFCPLQAVAEFEMMLLELLENMSIQKYCK
jgi:hypothetical protein